MSETEFILGAQLEQENPHELLDHLGSPYQDFKHKLIRRVVARPWRKSSIVVVGGLSESGKSVTVSQAEGDLADDPEVQAVEKELGESVQQLHIDIGDGMNLFAQTIQDRAEIPRIGSYSPVDYMDISAIMTGAVSHAAIYTQRPRIIWVQSTLLPGLVEKNGSITGLDKGLSTAKALVANLNAFAVLIFGSSETRKIGAAFKSEVLQATPEQIPAILEKYHIKDNRRPEEIIAYTRDHSSNPQTRMQSLEGVRAMRDRLIVLGEMDPPPFTYGDESFDDEMLDLKERYAPPFLSRLCGGEIPQDRAFVMFNSAFKKDERLNVAGSIYQEKSLVRILEDEARTTPIIIHRRTLHDLGIRG